MSQAERQKWLLVALLVLLPLIALRNLKPWLMDAARGGLASLGRAPDDSQSPWLDTEVVDLQLGDLEVDIRDYKPGRNLFRFAPKPQPPPPKPPPPVVRQEASTPPPPVEYVPRPPDIDVSLLGIFGPEKRRIAVLTDEDNAILNVQENEVFKQLFFVEKIDLQWVWIGFVEFPDEPAVKLEIGS